MQLGQYSSTAWARAGSVLIDRCTESRPCSRAVVRKERKTPTKALLVGALPAGLKKINSLTS